MSSSTPVVVAPTYLYVKSRAPSEDPPFELAFGKALDVAISQYNYYSHRTWRPLLRQAQRCAMAVLRQELKRLGVKVDREELDEAARRLWRMLAAWSRSPYTAFLRPKTHVLIFIDEKQGFTGALYAQPDLIDRISGKFYEVKSFDIEARPRKHVELQSKIFSLLGPLYMVYFREVGGLFQIHEKKTSPDPTIINDVIAFLQEKPPGSETVSLNHLRRNYPYRVYVCEEDSWKAR